MKRSITASVGLILLVLLLIAHPSLASSQTADITATADIQEHEPIILSGNGDTLKVFELNFSPSRITLQGRAVVEITGGQFPVAYFSSEYEHQQSFTVLAYYEGSVGARVEATGDWTLVIEPVKGGGVLPLSGTGSFISDIIELIEPLQITFVADGSKANGVSRISAWMNYPPTADGGWEEEWLVLGGLITPEIPRITTKVLLNPEGQIKSGIITVYCGHEVEWSVLVDGLSAPVTYAELSLGDRGAEVLTLKQRFFELGYFRTEKFNDQYTQNTADTVRLFEKNNGLPQDGIADAEMLALLFSDGAVGK